MFGYVICTTLDSVSIGSKKVDFCVSGSSALSTPNWGVGEIRLKVIPTRLYQFRDCSKPTDPIGMILVTIERSRKKIKNK